jgi:hypothetical protein
MFLKMSLEAWSRAVSPVPIIPATGPLSATGLTREPGPRTAGTAHGLHVGRPTEDRVRVTVVQPNPIGPAAPRPSHARAACHPEDAELGLTLHNAIDSFHNTLLR